MHMLSTSLSNSVSRLLSTAVAAALIGNLSAAWAGDTAEVKQYSIKQSEPNTGSTVRQTIIKAGPVPLSKTYAELSDEEKQALKAGYEKMGATDEPPFPAKGLMPILSLVRKAHEGSALKYQGPLALKVMVGVDGKPIGYKVEETPSADLANVAAAALMQQFYKPAHCNGAPCQMMYSFSVELTGPDQRDLLGNEEQSKTTTRRPF
jgi:hypothetical protein